MQQTAFTALCVAEGHTGEGALRVTWYEQKHLTVSVFFHAFIAAFTLHSRSIYCFSIVWLCVFWWSSGVCEALNHVCQAWSDDKVGTPQDVSVWTKSHGWLANWLPDSVISGGCVCVCALWKWFALFVFSISFLLFLPPVNTFLNHPGCRNRTSAEPPAMLCISACCVNLRYDIDLWFLFCFIGLEIIKLHFKGLRWSPCLVCVTSRVKFQRWIFISITGHLWQSTVQHWNFPSSLSFLHVTFNFNSPSMWKQAQN